MESGIGGARVFVKISEYNEIVESLELIKDKLSEAKKALGDINELKNDEDSEISLWSSTLEDIEKKVEDIDNKLFKPEGIR